MRHFIVDPARFASDALDEETIVMDLVSGRVFLLEMGAAYLWHHVLRGTSRQNIIDAVDIRYGSATRIACEAFLDRLVELELTAEVEVLRDLDAGPETLPWPIALGELVLTQYDDMTSIITMDPIHDVDPERGWPFNDRS